MGAARAAIEPGARIAPIVRQRAAEGVLEEADITLGRADEHRDFVERHTAARFLDDAPRNLDRFAPFTGRGEESHVARGLARRRLRLREQVPAQRDQVGIARLLQYLRFQSERREPLQRRDVAEGDGHEGALG